MDYTCPHCLKHLTGKDLSIGAILQQAYPQCIHCHTELEISRPEDNSIYSRLQSIFFFLMMVFFIVTHYYPIFSRTTQIQEIALFSVIIPGLLALMRYLKSDKKSTESSELIVRDLNPEAIATSEHRIKWNTIKLFIITPVTLMYLYVIYQKMGS